MELLEVMQLRMGEVVLVLWLSRHEGVGVFAGGGGVGTEIGLAGGDFGEGAGGETDAKGVVGVVVGAEGAGGGIDDVGGVV